MSLLKRNNKYSIYTAEEEERCNQQQNGERSAISAHFLTAEEMHRMGVKVWFEDFCEIKKGGFSSMMKSAAQKQKKLFVLPGKVCWVKGEVNDRSAQLRTALDTDKHIVIHSQLKETVSKKEVTLEFPEVFLPLPPELQHAKGGGSGANTKTIKVVFQFATEDVAQRFAHCIKLEKSRHYITSANFTPRFAAELNSAVRTRIESGDPALKELYLSCLNQNPPTTAIEALFTNYRSMTDFEEPCPVAFTSLLSAVAEDSVIYVLYLCCSIESNQAMKENFNEIALSRGIGAAKNFTEIFYELLFIVYCTVNAPDWRTHRELFLAQFQFPTLASMHGPNSNVTGKLVMFFLLFFFLFCCLFVSFCYCFCLFIFFLL
jgi:hypothetical protein